MGQTTHDIKLVITGGENAESIRDFLLSEVKDVKQKFKDEVELSAKCKGMCDMLESKLDLLDAHKTKLLSHFRVG